jgi:hypothetical protein
MVCFIVLMIEGKIRIVQTLWIFFNSNDGAMNNIGGLDITIIIICLMIATAACIAHCCPSGPSKTSRFRSEDPKMAARRAEARAKAKEAEKKQKPRWIAFCCPIGMAIG